jgi:penicillin-binding protein 1B
MSLGLENVANAIHLLGFEEDIVTRPSILLGAINMSPLQINQMYLAFAKQGELEQVHAINKIVSSYGETLWQFEPVTTKIISTNASYLMDYALMQVAKTGTAKSLSWRLKNGKVAGKTGTSNDLRDSWFVGFDEKNLVTTWLGKDNNKPTGLTGSSGALLLFTEFIKKQGVVNKIDKQPDAVAMTMFEVKTGNAVTSNCADTETYPAIIAGLSVSQVCLKERSDGKSWLEKLFSFTEN